MIDIMELVMVNESDLNGDYKFNGIVNKVLAIADVTHIYIFGKKVFEYSRFNEGFESKNVYKNIEHYGMLAITSTKPEKVVYTVDNATVLYYSIEEVSDRLENNDRFFHTVLRKSYNLYADKESNIPALPTYKEIEGFVENKTYWDTRYDRGVSFLHAAEICFNSENEAVGVVLLKGALEQICLGLIAITLGYKPINFSFHHLFDLCDTFTEITGDVFPQNLEDDKRMFNILAKSSDDIRFEDDYFIDPIEAQILYHRSKTFFYTVEKFVDEKLIELEPKSD